MSIGHVNLRLDEIPSEFELKTWTANALTIDFLTPDQAAILDTQEIGENTVLAMFANRKKLVAWQSQ